MPVNRRILLVEDDADIAALLVVHLSDYGAEIVHVTDGVDALTYALQEQWDMLILDLGLPGIDGVVIARQIRRLDSAIPILMVTARGTEADRVQGLDAGADDYIVKPFSMAELVARVRALFRRSETSHRGLEQQALVAGDLILDANTRTVSVTGDTVELTCREFGLLAAFIAQPGKTFRRRELLESVWGTQYEGYQHTVNTHINRLRAKIEPDPANPRYILTVWGVGYRFNC
ncbi:response regulator transcription factor [Granulosicoccus sp. 3-233]|uniref:response regulator transcription factor n=1 Tax=Granulosicoccus sp. 3-233 TaxID=3417969 RepID=UPI003D336DB0